MTKTRDLSSAFHAIQDAIREGALNQCRQENPWEVYRLISQSNTLRRQEEQIRRSLGLERA